MNKSDIKRNYPMLKGRFARKGYDWWWHNFTAVNEETGEEKSFFIEYFTCNPKSKRQGPVFGQLPENQKNHIKPSYLMVKAGWWGTDATQLHRFFNWEQVHIGTNDKGFFVKAADCSACETSIKGTINISEEAANNHPEWMSDSGRLEWDIKVQKEIAFNVGYGAGSLFRFLTAFEMYWHAEGMKTKYSGTITANGTKYTIKNENSYGYADKNWGADFTSPWVWLSSNDLISKKSGRRLYNSVFDIGGGRPKAFGIALNRQLLSDFWYEGNSYEFNFSKFWTGCKTEFECKETETEIIWYVRQETKKAVMESNISCQKNNMLLVKYEAPDGKKRHNRLWNGGTGQGTIKLYKKVRNSDKQKVLELIDEVEARHIGCEFGEYC